MTLHYMLDTNVLISVLRKQPGSLRRRMSRHQAQLAVSSITTSELFYGVHRSADPDHNRRALEGLLPFVAELDFDHAAAEHSAEVRADLAARGTPIGAYDLLIAGHARSRGLTVVTNNRREFERVDGLLVEDWTRP